MGPWLWLSLSVAFFQSLKDVTSKHSLRDTNVYTVAFALRFLSLPLLAVFLFSRGLPAIQSDFWWLLAASAAGNGLVTILYMKALESDDLNVALPMLAFTPVFLLITSPLMLGEFPGPAGLGGILCIVAGSYLLHLRAGASGILGPFRALLSRRGARLMLLVAFLWSITANIDRLGIAASSAACWGFASHAAIALFLAPTLLLPGARAPTGDARGSTRPPASLAARWGPLLLLGCFAALRQISQVSALELTLTAYVISIKRLSIVIGMILGALLFREETGPARLAGAAIMVAGAAAIGIYG